jgi:hypothetical protein
VVKSEEDAAQAGKKIDEFLKNSTCSKDDFARYLNTIDKKYADEYVNTGKWPSRIQIPKSPDVLKADESIDWAKAKEGGYVLDANGEAIRESYAPSVDEVIDRYGPADGRYVCPVIDEPFIYDQRSLPFVEDANVYHKYKVTGDFNNIEHYFNCSIDEKLKQKISAYMKKFKLKFSDLTAYRGKIASAFGSTGGGIQYELPLPVDMMESLGLIKEF